MSPTTQTRGATRADRAVPTDRDRLYSETRGRIEDFDFGRDTAAVFDDMLDRSVPQYRVIQEMVAQLACDFARPGTAVVDLGCSTATSIVALDRLLPADLAVRFVGIDSSEEMLAKARAKIAERGVRRPVDLQCADLNGSLPLAGVSVALLVLTLQFVRPLQRERLLRDVRRGLVDGGALILVEKVLGDTPLFNRLWIDHYYRFKESNGYTRLEIAQKREALENVLIPYRLDENRELLARCGFSQADVFFKWYNFCGVVATT
ncbi:MAG TPA: carboxy-S-adenosyl-L-methionine synthase CmoA [Candidatus Polarisedimenticolia bacterium]|nr:carboxy-S-adenosyl-L-methionine synthase CmoA [Candidatus Polarisedimenticolia bacterium]